MSLLRLTPLALLTLVLCGCTISPPPPDLCQPLILPASLMKPARVLRSLPSLQPSPTTTPAATPTPSS